MLDVDPVVRRGARICEQGKRRRYCKETEFLGIISTRASCSNNIYLGSGDYRQSLTPARPLQKKNRNQQKSLTEGHLTRSGVVESKRCCGDECACGEMCSGILEGCWTQQEWVGVPIVRMGRREVWSMWSTFFFTWCINIYFSDHSPSPLLPPSILAISLACCFTF